MMLKTLFYTLKVWFTSVMVSPLLFSFVTLYTKKPYNQTFDKTIAALCLRYLVFTVAELIFSFITWVAFFVAVGFIKRFMFHSNTRDWLIFITAISLTIITFLVASGIVELLFQNNEFWELLLCNCLCIGWGCWYYNPGPGSHQEFTI